MIERDTTAERVLEYLSDTEGYPDEALAPYKEFSIDGKTYYFTPGTTTPKPRINNTYETRLLIDKTHHGATTTLRQAT